MSTVLPIVLLSLIIIAGVAMFQAYQGLFSSFIMLILTLVSAAIAFNYCELLGWSLGAWHPDHLLFIILFGGLMLLAGLAKSIMITNRYVRLAVGIAAIVFLIVLGSRVKMESGAATGNAYGQAAALVGLFVISLLSLRAIADNVLLGNMTFPWQVERVGGGILGFFTGMIVAGVALIALQLMPFGPGLLSSEYQDFHGLTVTTRTKPADKNRREWRIITRIKHEVSPPPEDGWASYNRYDQQMKLQAAPFPYADDFTLAFMKVLSNGSLGAKHSFEKAHPDLLLEAWANRNGLNFQSRQAVPGSAIISAQWKLSQEPSLEPERNPTARGILSLTLSSDASDTDSTLRFKGPQVRLVGKSGKSYWPLGIHWEHLSWEKLYADLSDLAMAGANPDGGRLLYYRADHWLWGKDRREQRIKIRREIRGYDGDKMWWQIQLFGQSGDLRVLPASLAVTHSIGQEGQATIELIFEIEETDTPDYVVFKRTAAKTVQMEKPAQPNEKNAQK